MLQLLALQAVLFADVPQRSGRCGCRVRGGDPLFAFPGVGYVHRDLDDVGVLCLAVRGDAGDRAPVRCKDDVHCAFCFHALFL